jgi:hypothetical protein
LFLFEAKTGITFAQQNVLRPTTFQSHLTQAAAIEVKFTEKGVEL